MTKQNQKRELCRLYISREDDNQRSQVGETLQMFENKHKNRKDVRLQMLRETSNEAAVRNQRSLEKMEETKKSKEGYLDQLWDKHEKDQEAVDKQIRNAHKQIFKLY